MWCSRRVCKPVLANTLQYSCLENPTDREDWQTMVHMVTKSQTRPKQPCVHRCKTFFACGRPDPVSVEHEDGAAAWLLGTLAAPSVQGHGILSRVKQITSLGWMHETSARGWCTGKTQRDQVEREVGGGIRMGNTCKSMANSCQCMTRTTTVL